VHVITDTFIHDYILVSLLLSLSNVIGMRIYYEVP